MLVKKINPDWYPAENKYLRVNETIDITNPKALILDGDVIAIDNTGKEVSAYDLYGVLVDHEMAEFQTFLKMKQVEKEKMRLEQEQKELQAQLATTTPAVSTPPAETSVSTTPVTPVVEKPVEKTVEVVSDVKVTEEKTETFGERMAKARAAAKARKEAIQ